MKIAVVGAGISGLGASLILSQAHEVELFEADSRVGGHAHTVEVAGAGPVDVGFLVYNELTYPHLCALFRYLGVTTVESDMSLSIQVKKSGLEWNGTNLNSVFGQRRNLFRLRFYRMIFEILRFHKEAEANLERASKNGWTLRDLLEQRKFAQVLQSDYVLPMGAAIWSTPEREMLDYPAATFLSFFLNHKLLQVNDRPVWRTVNGGSQEYVKKAEARLKTIHRKSAVIGIEKVQHGLCVRTRERETLFDKVVMATHAPTTLKILQDSLPKQREVLKAFQVQENTSTLHRDPTSMPKNKRCWASWNAFAGNLNKASLTYYLNRLQPLKTKTDYFLTLNPTENYGDEVARFAYAHPHFDWPAIHAQAALPKIQGLDGIYFAGAWTRYGFHEDGLLSAVKVGECFDLKPPWAGS